MDTTHPYRGIKYFQSLNGLRFIAAFLVVMHHSETIRNKNGLFNLDDYTLFKNGGTAVTFFFVLSGFLITYLLMKEHAKTGKIAVGHFYVRRILRIWPLYYLLVLLGTLIVPFALNAISFHYEMPYTFGQVWYWFAFFMPFMVNFKFGHHLLEPLWSIGVEEVFYLMWAPLIKFLRKHILVLLFAVIAIKVALLYLAMYVFHNELFSYVANTLQFEAMAIGGLGAYWVYNRKQQVSNAKLFSKPMQVVLIIVILIRLCLQNTLATNGLYSMIFNTPVLSALLLDLLFLYLILDLSLNSKRLFSLENNILNRLGEISYGIYMYHMLIVFAVILIFKKHLLLMHPVTGTLAYYATVGICVIGVAWLSKKFFEDKFLKLKHKFD